MDTDSNTFELEELELDDILSILDGLKYIVPITFLYHEKGPTFVELYRGQVPTEKSINSISQVKLAIKYKRLKKINYFKIDGSVYSFSPGIQSPDQEDGTYTTGRTDKVWPTLEACKQEIHELLMINPMCFVDVEDGTLGPTLEDRQKSRNEQRLEEPAKGAISEPRLVEYAGSEKTITAYLEKYRPEHQELVDGIPINPKMRPDFDMTTNEDRDPLEIQDWWGRPYIVTCNWDDNSETWNGYVKRLKQYSDIEPEEKDVFENRQNKSKKSWLEAFPSGVRYEVRCLNGGAWDRSTSLGMVGSLDEALALITTERS